MLKTWHWGLALISLLQIRGVHAYDKNGQKAIEANILFKYVSYLP